MATSPPAFFEKDSRASAFSPGADRRLYFREKVLLSELELEDGHRGIVLDISEQGLAMRSAETLHTAANTRLRFQLSQSEKWIEAEGRLTWTNPARDAAGIEFIDLSDDALAAIKSWMFTIALWRTADELNMEAKPGDAAHWRAGVAWLSCAAIILAALLIFGWHHRAWNSRPPEHVARGQIAATGQIAPIAAPEPPSAVVPAGELPASSASTTPVESAVVLQVAAMQSANNALALANTLRAKNLPVFVLKPAGGTLYLVLVGPFHDRAAVATARAEVKSQGLDVIEKRSSSLK